MNQSQFNLAMNAANDAEAVENVFQVGGLLIANVALGMVFYWAEKFTGFHPLLSAAVVLGFLYLCCLMVTSIRFRKGGPLKNAAKALGFGLLFFVPTWVILIPVAVAAGLAWLVGYTLFLLGRKLHLAFH